MSDSSISHEQKFDLFSSKFKADPFPTFAHMRREAPIYGHKAPDGSTIWYITKYEIVLAVLRDNIHFCKDPRNTGIPEVAGNASRKTTTHRLINENMLFSDPPNHTRLRSLISQVFTPQRIAHQSGFIQEKTYQLIEGFRDKGEVDLISAFALPLPVFVICRLLGIPDEDRENVARWSQAIISPGSRNLNFSARKQRVQSLIQYLTHIFSLRSTRPQDDLISALVHAEEAGDKLSDAELSSMVILLIVTGHETTVNLIGNGVLALLQNEDQCLKLRNDPLLWDNTVEELLRYDGPVETSTSRWACKDIMLDGCQIRQGDQVRVVLASANRDSDHFQFPDTMEISRVNNPHLAFGYGIHYCLGAPLARLEGKIALRTLFETLDHLRLKNPVNQLKWRKGVLFRGLQNLEVRWDVTKIAK
jgi:cytochrome P450